MLCEFEKKIADFISARHLFDSADRVLLAVSGGADSVALMFALVRLTKSQIITANLLVGHVNHNLRGDASDRDEQFVISMAGRFGIKTITRPVDVRRYAAEYKLSVETAGRQLRAGALAEIANENGCKLIVTAHHKNDNAETIIHRLLRGTGFRGLAGIRPKNVFSGGITFVRPMLCVSREQIIEYCNVNNLDWRHDHTNDDVSYTRNKIRRLLLPELQAGCDGSLAEELASLSENCRMLYNRICARIEKLWPVVVLAQEGCKVVLDRKAFFGQSEIVQAELFRRVLVAIGSGERNLKEVHYRQVMDLANGTGGGTIELPGGFLARGEYETIIFSRSIAKDGLPAESKTIKIGGKVEFEDCLISAKVLDAKDCNLDEFKAGKDEFAEWFDFDKLVGPLIVRQRRAGDRFWPIGGAGEKKVGKFLTAAKVPYEVRESLLIIADSEKIIWLGPLRAAEDTKVTEQTQRILELKIFF
ncbi:MAG: tRNA lysidine(34) synthetase TilS [Planctomycetota bacterium]|jgi:tRNA(Ile)-lysidine synthase